MRREHGRGPDERLEPRNVREAPPLLVGQALRGGLDKELHHFPGLPLPEVQLVGQVEEKVDLDAELVQPVGRRGGGRGGGRVFLLGRALSWLLAGDDSVVGDGAVVGAVAPGLGVAAPVLDVLFRRLLALRGGAEVLDGSGSDAEIIYGGDLEGEETVA